MRLLRTIVLGAALVALAAWLVVGLVATGIRGSVKKPARAASPAGVRIVSGSYLGGEARDSGGPGPVPSTLQLIWRLKVGQGWTRRKGDEKRVLWSGTGWTGQPTLVEDAGKRWLVLGAYDHNLRKIDADTGEVAWTYAYDDVIKGTNTVFVDENATSEADRIVVASGARRGSDYRVGDKRIAPLRAVSFRTGRELWRLPVPKTDNYSQDVDSSPLYIDGSLYAPVEPGYVYRLDPSRTTTWGAYRAPVVQARSRRLYTSIDALLHPDVGGYNVAIESSPARIGRTLYLSSGSGRVYGLSIPSLKTVWDYRIGADLDGTVAVTRDRRLLVPVEREYVSGPGGVFLLDPSKKPASSPVWFFPTPGRGWGEWAGGVVGSVTTNEAAHPSGDRPRLAAFLSVDGNLYVTSLDTLSKRTAKGPDGRTKFPVPLEVFRERIGGSISTPVVVGDTIVAASSEKVVRLYRIEYLPADAAGGVALKAPDGTAWRVRIVRTAQYRLGGGVESTPLVAGGRVYLGCRDGYLYCLGDR